MKILLAEKSKNIVSALMLVITTIKDKEVKEIDIIMHADKVDSLYKKLKKQKPDILIINGGFVNSKTREAVPGIQRMYPDMAILILSIDPELKKKYLEIGIKNFIIKGGSAEVFYASMCGFLKNEQIKISNLKPKAINFKNFMN
jgi:DNA-binding NarL/FixJ family response regulator